MELDAIFRELPESVREQFRESVLGHYQYGKCCALAILARHLVKLGCTDVKFRKKLMSPDGVKFYADIYCGDRNLYLLCLNSSSAWLPNRIDIIRQLDRNGKVTVAVQDWLAWWISEREVKADEVLVVGVNGEVMGLGEWMGNRRRELEETALAYTRRLESLQQHYKEVDEVCGSIIRGQRHLCELLSWQLLSLAEALHIENTDWLSGREYQTEIDELVKGLLRKKKLAGKKMLEALAEFANKMLMKYTPYELHVTDEGKIFVRHRTEAEAWLGWRDETIDPAHIVAMRKELSIIAEAVKKARSEEKILPEKPNEPSTPPEEKRPQTVSVPREVLEDMLRRIQRIEEITKTLRF